MKSGPHFAMRNYDFWLIHKNTHLRKETKAHFLFLKLIRNGSSFLDIAVQISGYATAKGLSFFNTLNNLIHPETPRHSFRELQIT